MPLQQAIPVSLHPKYELLSRTLVRPDGTRRRNLSCSRFCLSLINRSRSLFCIDIILRLPSHMEYESRMPPYMDYPSRGPAQFVPAQIAPEEKEGRSPPKLKSDRKDRRCNIL